MAYPQYKISSYSKFLLQLACELTSEDIDRIKLVLAAEEILPPDKRDRIQTAAEVFVQLQGISMLGPRNVTFFEEVLPEIGRGDLCHLIINFKQLWDTPFEFPVQDVPKPTYFIGSETMTSYSDVDMRSDSDRQSPHASCSSLSHSRVHSRSCPSSLSDDEKMEETKIRSKEKEQKKPPKKSLMRIFKGKAKI